MVKNSFSKSDYIKWYKDMLLWRKVEEKASALYIQQKIRGFLHLYNGQEAVLAGTVHAINPKKDKMITAYRNHVHPIAMGVDPKYIIAELMGKATGLSKGNGGSMHMFSKKYNFFGGHGIVGGQIPLGAGIAFSDKYKKDKCVTLCFMGDGAVRQGAFHETLSMAMSWKLPVIFIIENNGYAMGTSLERTSNVTDLYKLGCAFEMPCRAVNGMCVEEVAVETKEAVSHAYEGNGPTLLEMNTYRYKGHSMSDAQQYRTKEEIKKHQDIDPILQVKEILLKKKYANKKQINTIDYQVVEVVNKSVEFAESSPFPKPEDLYKNVYKQENYPFLK